MSLKREVKRKDIRDGLFEVPVEKRIGLVEPILMRQNPLGLLVIKELRKKPEGITTGELASILGKNNTNVRHSLMWLERYRLVIGWKLSRTVIWRLGTSSSDFFEFYKNEKVGQQITMAEQPKKI